MIDTPFRTFAETFANQLTISFCGHELIYDLICGVHTRGVGEVREHKFNWNFYISHVSMAMHLSQHKIYKYVKQIFIIF